MAHDKTRQAIATCASQHGCSGRAHVVGRPISADKSAQRLPSPPAWAAQALTDSYRKRRQAPGGRVKV